MIAPVNKVGQALPPANSILDSMKPANNRRRRIETQPKLPAPRLVRKGSVLVLSNPGAPKMSVDQLNEWIRKSRYREI
jgi:hypothetical protein